jgi:hypothetical protein
VENEEIGSVLTGPCNCFQKCCALQGAASVTKSSIANAVRIECNATVRPMPREYDDCEVFISRS